MASTVPDCQAIVDAANASDRAFMVGHICRFNPRYAAAKQEIDQGKIGRIISMYARRNIPAAVTTEILEKIEEPDDLDRVLTLSEAKERCDALWSQWFSMLQTAAPDRDLVASAMLSLIQRPQGTRPLRWVVDPVTGGVAVQRVNEVCADVQAELLRGVGFSHAVPIV